MNGTSPYGPPETYKDELFQETETLKLSGTPASAPPPAPLRFIPKPQNKNTPPSSRPTPILFQIQVGQFSTLEKAKEAKDLMLEKGYKTVIYFTGTITNPGSSICVFPKRFSNIKHISTPKTSPLKKKLFPLLLKKQMILIDSNKEIPCLD